MLFYSLFVAIVTALVSLTVEKDLSAWSLNSAQRLIPIIYSVSHFFIFIFQTTTMIVMVTVMVKQGLFGNVFQVSIIMWCVRRKGPVFGSIFHPFGVLFSIVAGVVVLGETFYLGRYNYLFFFNSEYVHIRVVRCGGRLIRLKIWMQFGRGGGGGGRILCRLVGKS